MSVLRAYRGGCHRGDVRFEVDTDLADLIECNCSICAKKGFLHLIVDPDRFRLLTPEDVFAEGTRRLRAALDRA